MEVERRISVGPNWERRMFHSNVLFLAAMIVIHRSSSEFTTFDSSIADVHFYFYMTVIFTNSLIVKFQVRVGQRIDGTADGCSCSWRLEVGSFLDFVIAGSC